MRKASSILLAVLLLAGCSDTASVELSNTTVVLDVYSGLRNPEWTLTEAEAGQLRARLRDLDEVSATVPQPVLGYRGFRVRDADVEIQITSGLIIVWSAGSHRSYRDSRGAEDYLLVQAHERGYGNLVARD